MNNHLVFEFNEFVMCSTMKNSITVTSSPKGDFVFSTRIYKENDLFSMFNTLISVSTETIITSSFDNYKLTELSWTRHCTNAKFGFYAIFCKGEGETKTCIAVNFFYPSRECARKGFKAFKEYFSIKRGF